MRSKELFEVRLRNSGLDHPDGLVPLEEVGEIAPLLRLAPPDAPETAKQRRGVPMRNRQPSRNEMRLV